MKTKLTCVFSVSMLLMFSGCSPDATPTVQLASHVEKPKRAVVLITADGVNRSVMDDLLAEGKLPNLRWMIDRGVQVENAVSGYPSITYAQLTSIVTGCYPGTHGITGNKWFDRQTLTYRNYTTAATYRLVDGDLQVDTLFQWLPDEFTVNIQCPVRKGADRVVDNWMTSGILWFFGSWHTVDRLMPLRFELIAELANELGRWPTLVHAYLPATDEVGHQYGADSKQYRECLCNVDTQVGRIRSALESADMLDRTYLIFVSDHGHAPVPKSKVLNLPGFLREKGYRVVDYAIENTFIEDRADRLKHADTVLIVGGDRRASISFRGVDRWDQKADPSLTNRILGVQSDSVFRHPAISLVVTRGEGKIGESVVLLHGAHGVSRVIRKTENGKKLYRYAPGESDALGDWADSDLQAFIDQGWHSSQEWLQATVSTDFPDIIVQSLELFDSQRAGDVILFAAEDWDFKTNGAGGHGSIHAIDMIVPMIFSGPGIKAGGRLHAARLVDVAPTIMEFLGRPSPLVDGVSRAGDLQDKPE